ncbi:MAG: YhbY family RNA-binding protein [ANME-2 cluster archaeon]|jgi:RNA-binding protein|nr:MAG: YhbY family RNA-binding protein [ANME-2 cluster archaeon]
MNKDVKPLTMKPLINIGKSGVTDQVVSEIKEQMKGKNEIKIRILRNAPASATETASEVASRTGFNVEDVRGRTAILSR